MIVNSSSRKFDVPLCHPRHRRHRRQHRRGGSTSILMTKITTDRIPITILTGFLGSGKTTLLNGLIRSPEMAKALVIINEFGSIGLDHDLIAFSNDDDTIVEMSSGCLCCTIKGELQTTLRDAPWRYARNGSCWFDRIVIETTGLADPAPILHTLMTDHQLNMLYRVDAIVTTVDAANAMATLDTQIECVKQIAVADRLILGRELINRIPIGCGF